MRYCKHGHAVVGYNAAPVFSRGKQRIRCRACHLAVDRKQYQEGKTWTQRNPDKARAHNLKWQRANAEHKAQYYANLPGEKLIQWRLNRRLAMAAKKRQEPDPKEPLRAGIRERAKAIQAGKMEELHGKVQV